MLAAAVLGGESRALSRFVSKKETNELGKYETPDTGVLRLRADIMASLVKLASPAFKLARTLPTSPS